MDRVIKRKFKFLRSLRSGIVLPLSAVAITSSVFLYLILWIIIK